jgi:hypothetical protein
VTFSYLNLKNVVDCGKDPFELMILELLLFGGFFTHFDLAGLNLRPGVGLPRRKIC